MVTEPIICPPHQRRVVVGDHMVWHEHDAAHCPYPVYVRGSSVLTAEQIRGVEPEEGATP